MSAGSRTGAVGTAANAAAGARVVTTAETRADRARAANGRRALREDMTRSLESDRGRVVCPFLDPKLLHMEGPPG